MLLNHMSTKVNGNTCFRLAGTQNTQFLTHTVPLHAPGRSSNPSLTIHCIYGQKSIRCPTSTAAPWVTCSSKKPHNDAIWEPGLLVQDAQPASRLRKHLKGQGDWQWVSTHGMDNLPRGLRGQGSCHSIHSLPQHRPTWLAQQLFLSFPTHERPRWLPFRDREAHQDLQSQLNLHLPRFSSNRYLAHIFNSTHFNTNFSLEGFDRENPHPSLKQTYNPMGLDRSTLVESSIPVSSWCSFENSQEKNRKV